jgi:hypothetical protein
MSRSPKVEEVVARITAARDELLAAVEGLADPQASHRPAETAWSIEDVLHHLALTEEAAVKLLARNLRKAQERQLPPDPDPHGSVVDAIDAAVAGADDKKVTAPDVVTPRSGITAAEALARLRASRDALVASLERLSAYDVSSLTFPHPFFGDFDTYQWVLVTGWHERRHTRQIERIKTDREFPS